MSKWKSYDYTALELSKMIKNKTLTVPPYQRGQVWKEKQQILLIDSIKNGYPFGSLLLYKKSEDSYQLIDGLQRMTTLYKYLSNPTYFFNEKDIDDVFLTKICELTEFINKNNEDVKKVIRDTIISWVKSQNKSVDNIRSLQINKCAETIADRFPILQDYKKYNELIELINNKLSSFIDECTSLAETKIPSIIYDGDAATLPTVFSRINSKGTHLSKYQILAATWTNDEYTISSKELDPIITYINNFYINLTTTDFAVTDFSLQSGVNKRKLNLYQIIFGFGKLLIDKFPLLFGKTGKATDAESCGFNLINACVGNKNNRLEKLPELFKKLFKEDNDVDTFLKQVYSCTKQVDRKFNGYLQFKLNSRDKNNTTVYHSEMQICSVIANVYIAKHLNVEYDYNQNIISREMLLGKKSKDFNNYWQDFSENAFRRYLIDILNGYWKGTGDNKLDEISLNKKYYTDEINKERMDAELQHWYDALNAERQEFKKVQTPKSQERLLLSIIYENTLNGFEISSDLNYDIEHLATKGLMKNKMSELNDEDIRLPISSFGNLCLLPEKNNRRKKDRTLYGDKQYLNAINNNNDLSLGKVEEKFSFTTCQDMEWTNTDYQKFERLKSDYYRFINNRFKKQKEIILKQLGY